MVPLSIPENENIDSVYKPEAPSYSSTLSR